MTTEETVTHARYTTGMDLLTEAEWLAERRLSLGASEAPAVLGISEHEEAIQVWMRKTGKAGAKDPTLKMLVGSWAEPTIERIYEHMTGTQLLSFAPYGHRARWRHATLPWMAATPDRLRPEGGAAEWDRGVWIVEFKHPSWRNRWLWNDGPTEDALVQTMHQYIVLESNAIPVLGVEIVPWFGSDDLEIHKIPVEEFDEELIEKIVRSETGFWKHVVEDTRPGVTSAVASKALNELHPMEEQGKVCELPPDLVRDWLHAKASVKEDEAREAEAAARIQAIMEDAEIGTVDDMKVCTWKHKTVTYRPQEARTVERREFAAARNWRKLLSL